MSEIRNYCAEVDRRRLCLRHYFAGVVSRPDVSVMTDAEVMLTFEEVRRVWRKYHSEDFDLVWSKRHE